MIKKIAVIIGGVALIAAAVIFLGKQPPRAQNLAAPGQASVKTSRDITIGFSLGTLREDRWAKDSELFQKDAEDLGATVNVLFGDNDLAKQVSQAENLILQGVNVLVVVPQDAKTMAAIVDLAHKSGIKVLAYDRLITNSDLDFYVSFDNTKVGEMQAKAVLDKVKSGNIAYIGGAPTDNNSYMLKAGAMRLLQPRIKSGELTLVLQSFTPDWKPEEAYKTMKAYLAAHKTIDGVIAANDGTAFGVIQALAEYGLAGKVPVSGQDAEMGACQRVVAGTQTVTVYKPVPLLAKKAAEIAVALARGQKVAANSKTNNGKIDVPTYLLSPIAVTRDNMMQTVIKDGYQTRDDVYVKASGK